MKMTKLGRHGPEVSQFGLGAMSFAGFYGPADDAESFRVLDALVEAGVTHIDTANVYGNGSAEELLGRWFKANPGVRDKIILATKAAIRRKMPDTGQRGLDNSPEHLESELNDSLVRMGVDHVDLFYVHRRDTRYDVEDVAGTLDRLRASGRTRTIGFSEIAPSTLRRAASVTHIDAVQSEYSLATRYPELGLLQECERLGTAFVAFSPVSRSYLTDTPFTEAKVDDTPFVAGNPRFQQPNYRFNIAATDKFRALAAEMGEPAAAIAIAWCIAQGEQVIPIPGTRTVEHLRELVRGAEITLTDSDLAAIDAALPVGWAHGDRYSEAQWVGPERYC